MRRLMLLSILLVVVLALMIGGVVSAAHTAPLPPLLTSLHLNYCGSPCWIGIVPDQTTILEARQRVTAAFANSTEYEARIDPQTAASVLWVMLITRPLYLEKLQSWQGFVSTWRYAQLLLSALR